MTESSDRSLEDKLGALLQALAKNKAETGKDEWEGKPEQEPLPISFAANSAAVEATDRPFDMTLEEYTKKKEEEAERKRKEEEEEAAKKKAAATKAKVAEALAGLELDDEEFEVVEVATTTKKKPQEEGTTATATTKKEESLDQLMVKYVGALEAHRKIEADVVRGETAQEDGSAASTTTTVEDLATILGKPNAKAVTIEGGGGSDGSLSSGPRPAPRTREEYEAMSMGDLAAELEAVLSGGNV